jgi:hypothetical protein
MAKDDSSDIPPHVLKIIEALIQFEADIKEQIAREAFHAGWEAGIKHVQEKVDFATKQSPPAEPMAIDPPRALSAEQIRTAMTANAPTIRRRGPSTKGVVYEAIVFRPGLRGVDLLERARINDPELHERTFRTALHRLKMEGKIEIVEGRWYPAGEAPASTQPKLIGDPDAPA